MTIGYLWLSYSSQPQFLERIANLNINILVLPSEQPNEVYMKLPYTQNNIQNIKTKTHS